MGGQVMEHQAGNQAIARGNRAKLREFEEKNKLYNRDVMFNNAQWRNDVQIQEIEQDQIYQAMVDQWTQQDQKLDSLFAKGDHKIEKELIKMYENDYAGTQTGKTAGRLALNNARKYGQAKSEILHELSMAKDEAKVSKDVSLAQAKSKSWKTYDNIKDAPIHGPTPLTPWLEPPKSSAGLLLGLAGTGIDAWKSHKDG